MLRFVKKIVIPVLAFLMLSSINLHPIKLTASLIEHDKKTSTLKMECRVFIDDFENSINKTLSKKINISALTKEDKKGIESYFAKYYKLTLNGKSVTFKYSSSEIVKEYNVFTIKFKASSIKLKKGDKLALTNTLFFKEFGGMQKNRVTTRIPPYINEDSHETNIVTDNFTLTL